MNISTGLHHAKHIILAWLFSVTLVGAFTTCGVRAEERSEAPLQLLTAEEASRPDIRNYGFSTPRPDNGPVIKVPEVEASEARPFPLDIGITPRDGVAFDPASLRLECLKSPAVDLSLRVRPYLTSEGLKMDRVSLPAGLHRFRVSINDVRGRMSEKDFTIVVSASF